MRLVCGTENIFLTAVPAEIFLLQPCAIESKNKNQKAEYEAFSKKCEAANSSKQIESKTRQQKRAVNEDDSN